MFRTGNMFGLQTPAPSNPLSPEQEAARVAILTLRDEFRSLVPGNGAMDDAIGSVRLTSIMPRAESAALRVGLPRESALALIGTTAAFMEAMRGYYRGTPPADMDRAVQAQLAGANKIDRDSPITQVLQELRIIASDSPIARTAPFPGS